MLTEKTTSKLFLIDGSALAYRSHFAFLNNPLTNSKGETTSAVFGFTRSLLKILDEEEPDYIAVVFDTPQPTFRHKAYADYKATRQKMPEDMATQLPRIKQVIEAFRIPIIEVPGYEADDVMGTLARKAEGENLLTYLVTGDKDFMQLVTSGVKIYNPKRAGDEVEIVDEEKVKEKLGVPPQQVIDVLGLMGDISDNVPGVPGIGPKTASQLIQEFSSLENVLENLDTVTKQKLRESLKQNAESARLSKKLVTIDTTAPIDLDFEQLKLGQSDNQRLVELFKELEFNTLLGRFTTQDMKTRAQYEIIATPAALEELVTNLRHTGSFTIDLETTHIDPMRAQIVGLSFSWNPGEAYFIPTIQNTSHYNETLFSEDTTDQRLDINLVLRKLKPVLEDDRIYKCGQNIKYDMMVLKRYGVSLKGLDFDTMVASYLLNPSGRQHNLDSLSLEYLNYKKIPISELIGLGKKQISMAEVPLEKVAHYACEDADITQQLRGILEPKLKEAGLFPLFQEVELPLISVLMEMEMNGVSLDVEFLHQMSLQLEKDLQKLEEEIYQLAGQKFNINSPKQLSEILFQKLKLPVLRRTKTGLSTDVSVLEELAKKHSLPRQLLEYRQLMKLKSTYVDALPKLINPETGRVHTSFNQTVTATGRLSSSDPNLQNIPIRTEVGAQIRRAFVPQDEDHVILDADYSQIELRIMAHLSKDSTLMESFQRGEDVHLRTAALIFNVPPEQVTADQRRQAKTVNFGIMYGMGAYGLAQRLEITPEEGQDFITDYFIKYPGVNEFIIKTISEARKKGYVTTLLNRRRYLPEILSDNRRMREFAERTAINTPIQGTAADLIKVAMINISRRLKERGLKARMILQVHDELVFEVPKEELEPIRQLVKQEMEGAIRLDVPIKVDIGVGANWLEAH